MNQQEVISKPIERLRHVIERPTRYMGAATSDAAHVFIYGISCAYDAVGVSLTSDLRRQATNSCGWVFSSAHGADQMREQGLSEEQSVQELLLIEIKMLELVSEGLAD